jgi:hypothetical protein
MADEKLSELGALSGEIADTDLIYVVRPGTAPESFKTTGANLKASIPAAAGDVEGPASAVDGRPALFDGTTGKLLKQASAALGTAAFAATSDFDAVGAAATVASNLTTHTSNTSNPHSVTKAQVGLTNVTDDAQTKAAIVPNTAPTAGQVLAGNAGNTAYAPVSVSGDATLASTGALTIAADAVTNAKQANMAANTVKVNATAGSENPTDLAMAASTILARLASGDIVAATVAQLNALLQLDGLTTAAAGFRGIPQTSVSAARTVAAADNGTHWYHPSSDTTPRTWTIDSNANVALPIGFTLTFINDASAGVITIAITTDTLVLAGAGTTGSRSLAANGIATIVKMTSTRWQINGTGLT